ncbi:MAG: lytic transglycosylase domain-containing protein [Blastocatellia bacterium]|nr:lytic transglycosylase domain-containing protein [Blastocatellia bacterium]
MDVLSRAALFEAVIAAAAQKEGVDPRILWTIAYNETRFRSWLTSPKNAQGLMQFIPTTASRFGLANPYEPNASIYASARYVKYLGGLFDSRLDSILAAYNAGEGTVSAYLHGRKIQSKGRVINPFGRRTMGGVPPYRETINYVSQGLKVYRWLETQGRFRSIKNESRIDDIVKAVTSKSRDTADAVPLTVYYDTRKGSRFLVNSGKRNNLQLIPLDGPVIISPDLRGIPVQRARSTFVGANKP